MGISKKEKNLKFIEGGFHENKKNFEILNYYFHSVCD